jgi:hypothetical protein
MSRSGSRGTLFIVNADGTNLRAVAKTLNVTDAPSWSPDAKWLAVAADDGNGTKVYRALVDSGSPLLLTARPLSIAFGLRRRFIICTTPAQPRLTAVTPEGRDYPLNVPQLAIRNGVRITSCRAVTKSWFGRGNTEMKIFRWLTLRLDRSVRSRI